MNRSCFPLHIGTFFTLATLLTLAAMMSLGFAMNFLAPQPRIVLPHILLFLLFCTPVLALLGFLFALFYLIRYRRWRYGIEVAVCASVLLFFVCFVP
jgi:hypothetical protein